MFSKSRTVLWKLKSLPINYAPTITFKPPVVSSADDKPLVSPTVVRLEGKSLHILPLRSDPTCALGTEHAENWMLLDFPGLSLRNQRNNCWYHASLHFLTAIPSVRILCLSAPLNTNS